MALEVATSPIYVDDGFIETGIEPFEPEVPLHSNLIKRTLTMESITSTSTTSAKRKRGQTISSILILPSQP